MRAHTMDYRNLARLTRKGDFMNIVNIETAKECADKFFSAQDVYPSREIPTVREFFSKV